MSHKKSGKVVIIIEGDYQGQEGKIYNHESPRDGKLKVYLDNGTNISISSYKCQITGYFD